MSEDKKMEQLLREMAAEYHQPPETPREAIWARIDAERAERRHAPARQATVIPFPVVRWAAAIAAVLVVGIVIGRVSVGPSEDPTLAAGASPDELVELGAVSQVAYRVAASEHLSRVETFLLLFQAEARAGRLDSANYSSPARGLLLSTRLLRGSSVSEDLGLQGLLDDVELVLAQIAQIRGSDQEEDLEFIDQGIQQRGVLVKLRSAIPAGPAQVAAQGAL